ncbi:MAG: DNA-3-methyladenine glycosylase I [Desulfobacteraceae bacterium]|nr:DNA-3-methyladenine glycosylase I [Desulfobacteraceae bacterium]
MQIKRCRWCTDDPEYIAYHDLEWAVPLRDDKSLFEFLILEGSQAGLSWLTILKKRENYRKAFEGFDPAAVARFDQRRITRLLSNPGIVRNRLKVEAAVKNARAVLKIKEKYGCLSDYLWRYVDGRPIQNAWKTHVQVPAATEQSKAMSKDLKAFGCSFVGPTICYAFMQAVGMVNDHTTDCFRYHEVRQLAG